MACLPTGQRRRLALGCPSRHARRMACAAFVLLALMAACGGAQASRWGKDYVPNVPVVTQDGKVFNFYDDLIKDKIFVVSFLFTSCRDVCPIAAARMAQLQDRLGDRVGKDVFFYSISVDPVNDTPDKMKKYAETFGAGPGWLFLTGIPEDIYQIRQRLGERSRFLGEHRNDVLLGNGTTNEWQRDSLMGDMERFITVLDQMDSSRSKRAPVTEHGGKVVEAYELKGPPGEALFIKVCSGCHTVGRGDRVGPDLAGISERRQRSWLVDFIASPERMRARKDPIALALMAKYPNVRMPGVGIAEDEAAELVAYIDGYRKPPAIALEPLLALTTQDGKRLSADDIKGRPLAIAFGFTHCPDVCPTTLLEWSNALAELGPAGRQAQGAVRVGRQRARYARGAEGLHDRLRSAHHRTDRQPERDRRRGRGPRRILREGAGRRRQLHLRPQHQDLRARRRASPGRQPRPQQRVLRPAQAARPPAGAEVTPITLVLSSASPAKPCELCEARSRPNLRSSVSRIDADGTA